MTQLLHFEDDQVREIVRLSYPYVACYNVIYKWAFSEDQPVAAHGFNKPGKQMYASPFLPQYHDPTLGEVFDRAYASPFFPCSPACWCPRDLRPDD